MVAHQNTEYGVLEGNLFHEAGLEVMEQAGANFIVNVTLNTRKEVTGVFSVTTDLILPLYHRSKSPPL
jgi:nickel-dependent lactate racemase